MACQLAQDNFWTDKAQYDAAERNFYSSKLLVDSTLETSECIESNTECTANLNKKNKKNKKEKKEMAAAAPSPTPAPVATTEVNSTSSESSNSKKSKKQKNKNANKNASTEADPIELVVADVAITPPPQPSATSVSAKKNKKNKEKAKNNVAAAEKAQSLINNVEKELAKNADKIDGSDATMTTKDSKEHKNKKKMAALNNKSNNEGSTQKDEKLAMNGGSGQCTLATEIAKAREHIKNSLDRMDGIAALASSPGAELLDRLSTVEKENAQLREVVNGLQKLVLSLSDRVSSIESKSSATAAPVSVAKAPVAAKDSEDDDGVDLFGSDSDEDDEAAAAVKEKLLADYAAKKSKKPVLIAKSNIILDVKPWDDETDMKEMEAQVRKIECEGLLWGAAKLVPLAYGIHKLQISTVVVDDLVSVDWLIEELEKIEDFVQSVDIAAFNKI